MQRALNGDRVNDYAAMRNSVHLRAPSAVLPTAVQAYEGVAVPSGTNTAIRAMVANAPRPQGRT